MADTGRDALRGAATSPAGVAPYAAPRRAPRRDRAPTRGLAVGATAVAALLAASDTAASGLVGDFDAPSDGSRSAAVAAPRAPVVWLGPGAAPLPADTRAALITAADEPLVAAPRAGAPGRGAARAGTRLPVFAAVAAEGCAGRWLLVGPSAWVCDARVELARGGGTAADLRPTQPLSDDGLPYDYYFVGDAGALGYAELDTAGMGRPAAEIEPGFVVAGTAAATSGGEAWVRTTKGVWVAARELAPVRPAALVGVQLAGALDAGFAHEEARVKERPGGGRELRTLTRFSSFRFVASTAHAGRRWYELSDGGWVSDAQVRVPELAEPPDDLSAHERWIDVDRQRQVLVALEGTRPVFATLVSTGRGPRGSEAETPAGSYRIWVKLLSSDMDNLEQAESAEHLYAIQDVPWVMYFHEGFGLHGTFWHRRFGHPQSHGCVNLSPRDAEWLFWWAGPTLPVGWSAALPTEYDPGTRVRIR